MTAEATHSLEIDGRTFEFVFRPSAPEHPLLVTLHGHNKSPRPSKLKSENFNVLCPVDNFGYNACGSWFLGEDGDFFWLKAMKEIIKHVYSGNYIFFIGSSMGGYGAILHGALNNAAGVYANIPQTVLLGSGYAGQGMDRYFKHIFGNQTDSPYNDLKRILDRGLPTHFDITATRWDKDGYLQEQVLDFVSHLTKHDLSFSFEVVAAHGHGLVMPLHEAAERLVLRTESSKKNAVAMRLENTKDESIKVIMAQSDTTKDPVSGSVLVADSLDEAKNLFTQNILAPETLWTGNKSHMAARFEVFIDRYGESLGASDRNDIVADILEKADRRATNRPLTVFITNPGSCGSHWLQAILVHQFRMSGCGEAYVASPVMKFLSEKAEVSRSYLLDCLHLAHSYDGANTPADVALINTAHATGWAISAKMSAPKLRIALVRNPISTVISRTFRKPAHRNEYFSSYSDDAYLTKNIEYVHKFYRHFKPENYDIVIRFEDLRSSMADVLKKLSPHLLNYRRAVTIEETVAHFQNAGGGTTNKFSGYAPLVPDSLRDRAAHELEDLRRILGYKD